MLNERNREPLEPWEWVVPKLSQEQPDPLLTGCVA